MTRRRRFGRARGALLALCVLGVACSEPLTPSRAATIIRHSGAFLSGSDEGRPVFDRVSALLPGDDRTPKGEEGDSYVAEFTYHWPEPAGVEGASRPVLELTGRAFLRRAVNGWAVDDRRSRTLMPSWPKLPKTPNPAWGASAPAGDRK